MQWFARVGNHYNCRAGLVAVSKLAQRRWHMPNTTFSFQFEFSAFESSSKLGLESELTCNNQTLDFGSAFANFAKLCVSEEALRREIFDVAITAVDLNT